MLVDSSQACLARVPCRDTMRIDMNASRTVFLLCVLLAAFQTVYYYDQTPPVMASHFDGQGHPNGSMTKSGFFGLHLGIVALMTLVFLVLPAILPHIPIALINLPRKDYWLAPERKDATLQRMSGQLTWFGCATLVFLIGVMELVIRANLPGANGTLPSDILWGMLVVFLAFTAVWTVTLVVRHFRVPG